MCRFSIPIIIITDNGRRFIDKGLVEFYKGLHIQHITSSVEHPQTNGQAEVANKVILQELKKRLGDAKGRWTDELLEVLWACHCTPQSTTQETPYCLAYGVDAMIPVETREPSLRRHLFNTRLNKESMLTSLDLVQELRDQVRIREEASKLRPSAAIIPKSNPDLFTMEI